MILEQTPIQIKSLAVKKLADEYVLSEVGVGGMSQDQLKLSATQYQYWEILRSGNTILKTVQVYLSQGKLISFIELLWLLEQLNARKWIFGPAAALIETIKQSHSIKSGKMNNAGRPFAEAQKKLEKSLEFMRFLGPDLRNIFSQNARVVSAAPKTQICQTGETTRDLFVVIEGFVGVYRTLSSGHKQLIGTLGPGSVFGERAFFLNVPRTADVVTLDNAQIAVFPYSEEIGKQISPNTSADLLHRLRAIQAILSSDIFQDLPTESLESLAFAGKLYSVEQGQIIIREGEIGQSFFVIVNGAFSVSKSGKPVRALGDGGVVGEVALMVSGGARTATVQAQRKSTVLEIGQDEFYNILGKNILLAKEIETLAWQRWQSDKAKVSN
jgi:CRP-like cAMP-binding protein